MTNFDFLLSVPDFVPFGEVAVAAAGVVVAVGEDSPEEEADTGSEMFVQTGAAARSAGVSLAQFY